MAAVDLDAAIGADSLAGLTVSRDRGLGVGVVADSTHTVTPFTRDRGLGGGFTANSVTALSLNDNDLLECFMVASSSATFAYLMVQPRPWRMPPPPPPPVLRQVPQPPRVPHLTIRLPE